MLFGLVAGARPQVEQVFVWEDGLFNVFADANVPAIAFPDVQSQGIGPNHHAHADISVSE